MTIAKIGSVGLGAARGFDRAALDFYPTDEKLTHALLKAESFEGNGIWEPACGDGAISTLLERRYLVHSTDIADYGYAATTVDFLETTKLRRDNIITNPPFKLWWKFALHAVELKPRKVALLGRLLLLEGWGRSIFFRQSQLSRVVIVGRGKMLPPDAIDKGHTGMICFAWYIWEPQKRVRNYGGPRIIWSKPE